MVAACSLKVLGHKFDQSVRLNWVWAPAPDCRKVSQGWDTSDRHRPEVAQTGGSAATSSGNLVGAALLGRAILFTVNSVGGLCSGWSGPLGMGWRFTTPRPGKTADRLSVVSSPPAQASTKALLSWQHPTAGSLSSSAHQTARSCWCPGRQLIAEDHTVDLAVFGRWEARTIVRLSGRIAGPRSKGEDTHGGR